MKTKHLNADWQIARPGRAFRRGFGALAILVAAATPFIDTVPSRWIFLFAGLGYCAVLSFTALGICLLPPRIRWRVLVGMIAGSTLGFLAMIVLLLSVATGRVEALSFIFPAVHWALGVLGCVLLFLALYGWYHRLTRDAAESS